MTLAVGHLHPRRDDWVNFAGTLGQQQVGKIDQAYGVSLYYEQQKLKGQDPGMSQAQLAFQGNEAGRTAAVATVEQLTGVHIDHFAEVNLDGFYELARVLGGVEKCSASTTRPAMMSAPRCEFPGNAATSIPGSGGRHWHSSASETGFAQP